MRKLKVALVVLFAMMMSLCLFACKKKDEKVIRNISSVNGVPEALTDSDTQATWNQKAASIKVNVRYEELDSGDTPEPEALTGGDIKVELIGIDWSDPQIGDYTVVITPKVHNPNNVSTSITIPFTHDFGAAVDGVEECEHCHARRTLKTENVTFAYDRFHNGVLDTFKNTESGYSEEAAASAFKKFGNVTVWGDNDDEVSVEVPTVTVGRLEKGTTITVKGTARDTWTDAGTDEAWFFPIIGIADRNANGTNPKYPEEVYKGGTSVLMRNDGHILYNGIGQGSYSSTSGNTGAKLAALAGSSSDTGFPNYGSGTSAAGGETDPVRGSYPVEGYGKLGALPAIGDWNDWYVYSLHTGDIHSPGPYAGEGTDVTLTWYYREDGVIEMTISASEGSRVFKGYVKVPDSKTGYYETVLHGEYTAYTFSESSMIETRKAEAVKIVGNEKVDYYENEMLDASAFKLQYQYNGAWEDAAISADMIEGKIGETWYKLDEEPLTTQMTEFRLNIVKGSFTQIVELKDGESGDYAKYAPKVVGNALVSANGGNYDDTLVNNNKVGSFKVSLEKGATNYIVLTPADATTYWAQGIPEGSFSWVNGTPAEGSRYVSLRLEAGKYGTFSNSEVSVTSGGTNVPYLLKLDSSNKVANLVLAVTEELAGEPVIVTGVNSTTALKIDLTAFKGYGATSSLSGGIKMTQKSNIIATYHVDPATEESKLSFREGRYEVKLTDISSTELTQPASFNHRVQKDVSKLASEGTVVITVELDPSSMREEAELAEYTLSLLLDGEVVAEDVPGYDFGGADKLHGGYFVQYDGLSTILFIRGTSSTNMQSSLMKDTFSVNLNAGGDPESLQLLDLSYAYSARYKEFRFTGKTPEGVRIYHKMIGTVNNENDVDSGYVVIISIDVTKFGIRTVNPTSDYYFEVKGDTDTTEEQLSFYKVTYDNGGGNSDEQIKKQISELTSTLLKQGDCLNESGLVGYPIEDGGEVVFYAGVSEIGGGHKWGSGAACENCGATKNEAVALTDVDSGVYTVESGSYVEITGKYSESVKHNQPFNGIETQLHSTSSSPYTVRIRNDGYYKREAGGDNQVQLLYNSTIPINGSTDGTCEGVPNGIDGEIIEGADYLDAKQGGSFKVTAYFVGGSTRIATVVTSLWTMDQEVTEVPYFTFTVQMKIGGLANSVGVTFRLDTNGTAVTLEGGKATVVQGKLSQSLVDSAEKATVNAKIGEAAAQDFSSDKITIEHTEYYVSAYEEGVLPEYAPSFKLGGVAGKLTSDQKTALGIEDDVYNYFVAFKATLSGAIVGNTDVRILDRATGKVYANGYAKLEGTQLEVVIPYDDGAELFTIDFMNDKADMHQGDIVVDVSGVSLKEVSMTADASKANILGGEVTLTVTGTVPEGSFLYVGEDSVEYSAIEVDTEIGGLTVTKKEGNVITFEVGAADLTEKLAAYDVKLLTAKGGFLAETTFDAAKVPVAADGITVIEGVYVKAEDHILYLVTASGVQKESTKTLKINVNGGTDVVDTNYELVADYDVSVKISESGEVTFLNGSNLLTAEGSAVWSDFGEGILAVRLDLSVLNIWDDTAYGFQLTVGETAMTDKAYLVKADRTMEEKTLSHSENLETLSDPTCGTFGLQARLHEEEGFSFYYDVTVTASHNWKIAENGGGAYVCETCGAVLKADNVKGLAVSKDLLAPKDKETTLADTGLTVSFYANAGGSDWGAQALGVSGYYITLPNLDPWNTTDPAVGDKYKGFNRFPATDNYRDGAAYDVFLNGSSYVTISISTTEGVKYYKDGVLKVEYGATEDINPDARYFAGLGGAGTNSLPEVYPTVADFVGDFFSCVAKNGLTIAGGLNSATGLLIEKKAYTDEEAEARYNNYLVEQGLYPVHGVGEEEHKDSDNNSKCDYCGAAMPHSHTYVNGVCSVCNEICTHKWTGNTCDYCHAEKSSETKSVTNAHYWSSNTFVELKSGLADSGEIIVTAQYSNFTSKEWSGAILGVTTTDGKYAFRYLDGAYTGGSTNAWNTVWGDDVVNTSATGTTWSHSTSGDGLPDTLFRAVVKYHDGTVTITVGKYAKADTDYATPIATRVITIGNVTGAITIGLSNADDSAFASDQVTVETLSWSN